MPGLNFSGNLSQLSIPGQNGCFVNGKLDLVCFNKEICGQLSSHWHNAGIAILGAYVIVDLIFPLFLKFIAPRLPESPLKAILVNHDWQLSALYFVKDRMIWAMALYIYLRLFL